jgi:hypothetical protein
MREAPGNTSVGPAGWRTWVAPGVVVAMVLLFFSWIGYALFRQAVEQAQLTWDEERAAIVAEASRIVEEANRKAEEAERQRIASVQAAEQERQRAAAEAERQQQANVRAEQERQTRAATEAEMRLREQVEQQRLAAAALKAEEGRHTKAREEAEAKRKAEEDERQRVAAAPARPNSPRSQEFPWPPPAASAFYVLPDNWFANLHTVGEVVRAIIPALERNGYVERSFFRIEGSGVAVVTRLERITGDGSSFAEPLRWPGPGYSLSGFLRGLFFVGPGRYRIIVFILRDRPFSQSSQVITRDEARAWLSSGADTLSPEAAQAPFGGWHCTALIYEFASDGMAVRVVESSLTGKQHLTKAGLLSLLEKN